MRFADIILDLAAVAKASGSVASRHWELRARQIDRYSQTSSVIRSLRHDRKESQRNAGSTPTRPAADATDSAQQQQPPPADPDHATEQILKAPITSEVPSKDPNLSTKWNSTQHSRPLKDAPTQRNTAPRPDQGAILAQLREKANLNASGDDKNTNADVTKNLVDDAPPGINVNVFHTSRGSQMLEGNDDTPGQPRLRASPPRPSWFKDFGHDKPRVPSEHKGGKPLPSISKSSGQGISPVEKSAAAADVAIARPQPAVTPKPRIEEDPAPVIKLSTGKKTNPEATGRKAYSPTPEGQLLNTQQPHIRKTEKEQSQMLQDIVSKETLIEKSKPETVAPPPEEPSPLPAYVLRESKVPATRLSRMWNYGGLAAGMLGGAITESISRGFGGGGQGSLMFSAGNLERLVAKLSRMRGTALKLGQMLSFQDSKLLPAPLQAVLQRVQDQADYMPAWQRDRVLASDLGPDWREILFADFEETPIAAASIGQVHRATLKTGEKVAVKVQFPGVADSISSDLNNISMLLMASGVLPKGLYLDKTIENARTELGWECDYERELACGKRYKELLATSEEKDVFDVPEIFERASGKHVLTMEFMEGVAVTRVNPLTQERRDWIGTQILRLCLREIVEFRFMQTDPNWTNFLYNANAGTGRLALLDFGASREFPAAFVTQYVSLLAAASRRDRDAVIDLSQKLGYLTGHESRAMIDAHVASILTLAEPFLRDAPEVYDFADQTITERVRDLIPVMVRERLSPPPEETYSLHRKLSGAFLLCARLGSRVRCRELFENALDKADHDV